MGKTQKVGWLGEELVVKFLMKRGYTILERNYRKPWGELDIVAEEKKKIHFIEVKTMSRRFVSDETPVVKPHRLDLLQWTPNTKVSDETARRKSALQYIHSREKNDCFRAEDNVNAGKMKRLSRIIQTYLSAKHVSSETNWQFDVATVYIDVERKKAKINFIGDLIL
ncbi:MAG: YraN family protein [Patescibacteria group bacterium]